MLPASIVWRGHFFPRATSEGFSFSRSSAGAGSFGPDTSGAHPERIRPIDSIELLSNCYRRTHPFYRFLGISDLGGFLGIGDLGGFLGISDLGGFLGISDLGGFLGTGEPTRPHPPAPARTRPPAGTVGPQPSG